MLVSRLAIVPKRTTRRSNGYRILNGYCCQKQIGLVTKRPAEGYDDECAAYGCRRKSTTYCDTACSVVEADISGAMATCQHQSWTTSRGSADEAVLDLHHEDDGFNQPQPEQQPDYATHEELAEAVNQVQENAYKTAPRYPAVT